MCLRFVFLLITRVAAWLRLSRREEEVEGRGDLDPAPPARHSPAAAAAPSEAELGGPGPARDPAQRDTENAAPEAVAAGYPDTIVRWHRDIVRRRWAARSMRGRT